MRTAPPRPDEAAAQRRVERRWLPPLAVLAVIAFVTAGSQLFGGGPGSTTAPAVDVGGVVTVTPEPGWEVVSTTQDGGVSQALLRRGAAGLLVVGVAAAVGSVEDLAREYAEDALRGRFAQLTMGQAAFDGPDRLRIGYVGITFDGIAVEGVVTVELAASGNGAVFDGFAPKGSLGSAVDDLRSMVESAEVA